MDKSDIGFVAGVMMMMVGISLTIIGVLTALADYGAIVAAASPHPHMHTQCETNKDLNNEH